ncbi:MAG: membrane protein insertase YidC [Ignavibacteriaceae bacterium]
MDRKSTLAFVIIGIIFIVWLYLNSPQQTENTASRHDTTLVVKDSLKKNSVEQRKISPTILGEIQNSDTTQTDSISFGKNFHEPVQNEKIITIENDLVKIEISNKGGDIKKYFLKKFKNWFSVDQPDTNFYTSHVQLVNYTIGGGGPDLAFVSSDGKAINTAKLFFKPSVENSYYKISNKDSLKISFTYLIDKNRYIKKNFIFYGDQYNMKCSVELVNMNNLISNNDYDIVWRKGLHFTEENSVDEALYANASAFYGDENVIVDASKFNEKVQKEFNGRVGWVAVRNKYFAAIIAPHSSSDVDGAFIEGVKLPYPDGGVRAFYNIRLVVPFNNTDYEKKSFDLYIGPADYDILKTYGHDLDAIVDFGSFLGIKFIIRPIAEYVLLPLFDFLHRFISNYGIVIIIFSLIIKLVLYLPSKSSLQSMKKMQMLQPMIAELKLKYKDDPTKLNKETMKLYSTYGINPAGGCLPLILQMPIFIALWGLFKVAIGLRQQPFVFWIKDLSRPDIILSLPFKIPIFGIDQISGLALLMGIATFIQQKMTVKDPTQQALVYVMPIMLTLMFMSFPSGLNLYYFMFNVFSIAQQYYINHKHDGMVLQPVKNPKNKKGFMTRMMEAAEQNAKTQQKKRR